MPWLPVFYPFPGPCTSALCSSLSIPSNYTRQTYLRRSSCKFTTFDRNLSDVPYSHRCSQCNTRYSELWMQRTFILFRRCWACERDCTVRRDRARGGLRCQNPRCKKPWDGCDALIWKEKDMTKSMFWKVVDVEEIQRKLRWKNRRIVKCYPAPYLVVSETSFCGS